MGQGKEVKTRPDPKVEIQEKGEVFFFYRPKVDKEEARSPDDVQRLYVVLRPESAAERAVEEKQAPDSGKEGKKRKTQHGDDQEGEGGHGKEEVNVEERPLLRLIVMGKKSLPDPAERSRPYWGYVDLVTTDVQDIKDALREEEYTTATRGKRRRPAARALGEGVYRILKHGAGGRGRAHTHLVYKLELPSPARGRARRRRCRRRRAAGGHERGAGGVLPHPDQEPRAAGRRPRRRQRVRGVAEQAQRGVPGAPAGAVREQAVRAGRPAGPAQLRGVRAAADLGLRRRRGGAGPGAANGDRDRDRNRARRRRRRRPPRRRGVLGPGEDVRRGVRREAAAERELGLELTHHDHQLS